MGYALLFGGAMTVLIPIGAAFGTLRAYVSDGSTVGVPYLVAGMWVAIGTATVLGAFASYVVARPWHAAAAGIVVSVPACLAANGFVLLATGRGDWVAYGVSQFMAVMYGAAAGRLFYFSPEESQEHLRTTNKGRRLRLTDLARHPDRTEIFRDLLLGIGRRERRYAKEMLVAGDATPDDDKPDCPTPKS